jgi:5-methyltetrahydrofolate--homocysteine methyltransferase
MATKLLETIRHRPLLADGAMGTQLMLAGLEAGACGEAWNLSHPDRVLAIQRAYVDAGADCLLTNTFGGSRIALERHGLGDRAAAINRAAVAIAREALGSRGGFVIGDIGPFGGLLEPLGEAREDDVRKAFAEQAQALVDAGADAIIVETQSSLEELALGLAAATGAGAPCVIGSMAFNVTRDGASFRTMMGIDPERAAAFMDQLGVDIVALNCGAGMDMARSLDAAARYRQVTTRPIMVQPNAGQPTLRGTRLTYDETPAQMAEGLIPLVTAGVRIVGACCGSTPDHIRALRQALDAWPGAGQPRPQKAP